MIGVEMVHISHMLRAPAYMDGVRLTWGANQPLPEGFDCLMRSLYGGGFSGYIWNESDVRRAIYTDIRIDKRGGIDGERPIERTVRHQVIEPERMLWNLCEHDIWMPRACNTFLEAGTRLLPVWKRAPGSTTVVCGPWSGIGTSYILLYYVGYKGRDLITGLCTRASFKSASKMAFDLGRFCAHDALVEMADIEVLAPPSASSVERY